MLVAVGEKGQAPTVLTEITQTAEVDGGITLLFEVLFAGDFPAFGRPAGREVRLFIGVDIAQCAAEADLQAEILPLIVFFGVGQNAALGLFADGGRDRFTAGVWVDGPASGFTFGFPHCYFQGSKD